MTEFHDFSESNETSYSRKPKPRTTAPLSVSAELQKPVRFIKGVGERLAILLARKEIKTIRDLLYFFPRTYEDRRKIDTIPNLKIGQQATVVGKIAAANPVFYSHSRRRAFEVILEDHEPAAKDFLRPTRLKLTFFSAPYLKNKFTPGLIVMANGEVKAFRGEIQMVHPEIEILGKELEPKVNLQGIISIYSETEGLFQKTIRKITQGAVKDFAPKLKDSLPQALRTQYQFPDLASALLQIHCPKETVDFDALLSSKTLAHERLIYEEFFEMSVSLALKRQEYTEASGRIFPKPKLLWERFASNLPFKFTGAQKRVLQELLEDFSSGKVMHRLIQGDVGCGKTVVAAASALVALEAGYQVVLMAPTELLVNQHFENFTRWFAGLDIPLLLLTGSSKAKDKREVLAAAALDRPQLIFGTHSLFEDRVQFGKLGLVIVDEQHRFGVRQRAQLMKKGEAPHVLVMTATPIPRTLALTLYGDLDLSVIDELPPGRKPIVTKVFTEKFRPHLEKEVLRELQLGRQVYIVFPLIEDSEKLKLKSIESMMPQITEAYSPFKVAFMHGKMPSDERNSVLQDFKSNKIQVLVSTTVIEVGVDIPNAAVMVVENAERFGLSQLHQLRGRIGRGSEQSYCFLLASHLGTPEIVQRLRTMEKVHDGFKLAEVDLDMRGPGEFLGTRQSGLPIFRLGRLPRDFELLQRARRDAFDLVAKDPSLVEHLELRQHLDLLNSLIQLN